MSYETARDSEDLLYYARRGAEKQYQLARLRERTRSLGDLDPARISIIQEAQVVQTKFEIARSDFGDLLERYAGKVSVVAPLTHVKATLTEATTTDTIIIEGTLTKVDYKKALFKIVTGSESVEVKYADFILQDGCTYPSPHDAIDLELVSPS